MKRVLTIQDISCIGRCSLTVAVPVISALGSECVALPTALLSSHTAFNDFVTYDLTDKIDEIIASWEKNEIKFDCIYSGYLASYTQIKKVIEIKDKFLKDGGMLIVDPVMGDFNKLYTGFTDDFPSHMLELCKEADIICPNITEALALLGMDYTKPFIDVDYGFISKELSSVTGAKTIITGFSSLQNKLGIIMYENINDSYFTYETDKIIVDRHLHGTGDLFASVLTGGIMADLSIEESLKLSVDFVYSCVKKDSIDDDSRWYGVGFENNLHLLTKQINNI